MDWQCKTVSETLQLLSVSAERGLSATEAEKRAKNDGPNRLRPLRKNSIFRRFIAQFRDFMVLVLLAAAAVSFVTAFAEPNGDFVDPIIILCIYIIYILFYCGIIRNTKAIIHSINLFL